VRGTVAVLPGRGEQAGVYERFGTRIAADSYAVHALAATSLQELTAAVTALAADGPSPLVLVGSDTGALRALALAALLDRRVDALVLAGVPSDSGFAGGWVDELDARTACPVHRGRLESELARGQLDNVPGALLVAAASARPAVPTLVLHGAADTVAPVEGARALANRLPHARLVTVLDGRHDVLNDLSHRSVAAEIVQFLERLRTPDWSRPILRVEVA